MSFEAMLQIESLTSIFLDGMLYSLIAPLVVPYIIRSPFAHAACLHICLHVIVPFFTC